MLTSEGPWPAEKIIAGTETAVILLDVENRFFWKSQDGPELPAAELIPNLARILGAARAKGALRVIVSTILDERADSDSWRRRRSILRQSMPWLARHTEWGSQVAPPFLPRPGEITVTKLRMSAFHGTSLEMYLRSRGVQTLVLAGVATNGAILATFLDSLSHDFHAFVVRDAVQGTSPELHDAALSIITSSNLVDTNSLCQAWQG
jgi:nicotinamidase-related amidase